jgi:uncharacterized protein YhfF
MRSKEIHISINEMWSAYLAGLGLALTTPLPPHWHFCDNRIDADACMHLVFSGRKRATTPSLWFFEARGLKVPRAGDLDIVTNWEGVAQCIIRTTAVSIIRFCDVTAEHAMAEGEGDGSLDYWRTVHWEYYQRELAGTRYAPVKDMPLVCQYFERVYP